MTPADARVLAEDIIKLNTLTNASYVSNNGIKEQAKLANIILDLVTQLEALQPGDAMIITYDTVGGEPLPKKRRGRPPKAGVKK